MNRRLLLVLAAIAVGLLVISQSVFVVKETDYAINLQLRELVRSDYQPGLHFKLPLVQSVEKFERRLLTRNYPSEQFLTSEGKILNVDFYVKWRIKDVGHYYRTTGGVEDVAGSRLGEIVKDGIKSVVARRTLQEIVAVEGECEHHQHECRKRQHLVHKHSTAPLDRQVLARGHARDADERRLALAQIDRRERLLLMHFDVAFADQFERRREA